MDANRSVWIVLIAVLASLALPVPVQACVGARPMAMGGAFVAVADDFTAVYWNPAGLARIRSRETGFTQTMNNRSYYNYDSFVSVVWPGPSGSGMGLSWISSDFMITDGLYYRSNWFVVSYGRDLSSSLALGTNIRMEHDAVKADGIPAQGGFRLAVDMSVMYSPAAWLNLGVLMQDAATMDLTGIGSPAPNLRTGVAIKPWSTTTLSLELYDVLAVFEQRTVRFGAEHRLDNRLAVRVGLYGIPALAPTLGFGYASTWFDLDYAFLGGALGDTHQVGMKFRF